MHQPTLFDVELWKPVPGYEGEYEVSSHGRVRSLARTIKRIDGRTARLAPRMLKPSALNSGHLAVSFWRNNKSEYWLAHRLVLEVFVGPAPEGYECCHNDGDPSNNRLDNLRWGTRSDNAQDALKHGTNHQVKKTHCPRGHVLELPNLVPSTLKRGRRGCLACQRGMGYWRHNRLPDSYLQPVTDRYYEAIMKS